MGISPVDKKPTFSRQNSARMVVGFCRAFGLRAKAARLIWVVPGFLAGLCIFILVSGFLTQNEPSFVFRGRVRFDVLPAADPSGLELARMLEAAALSADPFLPDGAWRAKAEAAPASGFRRTADSGCFSSYPTERALRDSGQIAIQTLEPERLFASAGGSRSMVSFAEGRVSVLTAQGGATIARLGENRPMPGSPLDLFQADLFTDDSNGGPAPLLYGEALDERGRPLRWTSPFLFARRDVDEEAVYGLCEVRRTVWPKFDGLNLAVGASSRVLSAAKYRDYVDAYAKKYNLTPSLVLAIMHTESNFNPGAVSPHNALGLMQVVASTAGEEAHAFLTGTKSVPKMETLFDPESNIRYGTAYLHILNQRYFGEVIREDSRNLCVIAAYNGGPGAVLRVFDTDSEVAIAKINALSPAELYATLAEKMPSLESRRYVGTVLGRMQQYN